MTDRATGALEGFGSATVPRSLREPTRLFLGGLSRVGSGIRTSNCGEVLAAGFGLESSVDAVHGKYLDARAVGLELYPWFHWPTRAVER